MLRCILKFFLIAISFLLIFSFKLFATVQKHYHSVQDLIKGQNVIRVIIDDATGYGLQVANMNHMNKIRAMGFKGKFEVIYSTRVRDKIATLFDLPQPLPAIYEDRKDGMEFISIGEFIQRHKNKTVVTQTLGFSGGIDTGPCAMADRDGVDIFHGMDPMDYANDADFANVKVFLQLNTFYKNTNMIYAAGNDEPETYYQKESINTFVTAPFPSLAATKRAVKDPALQAFIATLENQNYNILPVYGITLQRNCKLNTRIQDPGCFPGNILQIIAAARYTQLHGDKTFSKPLIIAVYYDYAAEAKILQAIIQESYWGEFEMQGSKQAQHMIQALDLAYSLQFGSISDPATIDKIKNLASGQILLLWLKPLAKHIFDGLYNYTGTNIWPQIREGNNSFSTLILTGKAHFRCGKKWELETLYIPDPMLQKQFQSLYNEQGFCRGMKTWHENEYLYREMSRQFIAASDPESALAKYFQSLKVTLSNPKQDRLQCALQSALRIVNQTT